MRNRSFGARWATAALILAVFALAAPASAAADDGASGSFEILSVQSGVMQLSITVSPGSAACEVGFGGISDCDWYAYVDVENAPGGNCQLYAPSDPSGDLGSQTNGDPQTAQEPLVTQVASGQCMLTLRYVDISGANDVLAQQPYTFSSPAAIFTDVTGTASGTGPFLATASATLSEPICPSDGACSWFGFVVAEPASTGCPASIDPGSGPAPSGSAPCWTGPAPRTQTSARCGIRRRARWSGAATSTVRVLPEPGQASSGRRLTHPRPCSRPHRRLRPPPRRSLNTRDDARQYPHLGVVGRARSVSTGGAEARSSQRSEPRAARSWGPAASAASSRGGRSPTPSRAP